MPPSIQKSGAGSPAGVRLTHVGGPTILIEVAGWRILTDPTFDPPGRRYTFGWGTASTKVTGPALAPADLGPIDAVLLTHDHHADNLDDAGRALLPGIPVVVTTASGARRLGPPARGLEPWDTTQLAAPGRPTVTVEATPCRHGPPLSHALVGDVVGFALSWEGATGALWCSGDTVLYDGVRAVAARIDVDIAVLHLGGAGFPVTGPVRYTMTAKDGIELCALVQPRVAVPVHYEGWSHFRDGLGPIEQALGDASDVVRDAFRILPIGTPVDV
jgi:L-ascorbate metabolism protein UlaG (beta-lactamase superfamily)